jgi:hypothetical protein
MINYFSKNKGHLKICEDSLSSSVFDLLKYLPSEIFWNILRKSLYHDKLPSISGELFAIKFWEKWSPEGTSNSNYVEPDIFLQFLDFDIIIEAKRHNEFQQKPDQRRSHIQSYSNEFGKNNKKLYYIQLGGLHNIEDEANEMSIIDVVICKTDWSKLLNQIIAEKKSIEDVNLSQLNSYKRIYTDLIRCFEMHGFFRKRWLSEMKITNRINTNNINKLFDYATK